MSKNTFAKEEKKKKKPNSLNRELYFLLGALDSPPPPSPRQGNISSQSSRSRTGFNKAFVSLQGCSFRFSFIPRCQDGVGRQLKSQADNIVWG